MGRLRCSVCSWQGMEDFRNNFFTILFWQVFDVPATEFLPNRYWDNLSSRAKGLMLFICSRDFHMYRWKSEKRNTRYGLHTPSLSYPLYPPDPYVLYYNRTRSHHRRAMNDTPFCSFMEEIVPNFPVLWIWIRIRKRIWKNSFQIRIRAAPDLKWTWSKTWLKNC